MFEDFWQVYPRRVAKSYAKQIYHDITSGGKWVVRKDTGERWFVQGTEDELDAGARRYAEQVRKEGTQQRHIPHPSTWMHEGRWEDEYEEDATVSAQDQSAKLHEARVRGYQKNGYWHPGWGEKPMTDNVVRIASADRFVND